MSKKKVLGKATTKSFFANDLIQKHLKDPKKRAMFNLTGVVFELFEQVAKTCEKRGISKEQLAKKIKISKKEMQRLAWGKAGEYKQIFMLFRMAVGLGLEPQIKLVKLVNMKERFNGKAHKWKKK